VDWPVEDLAPRLHSPGGAPTSQWRGVGSTRQVDWPVEDLARLEVREPRYLSALGPTIDGRAVLPGDIADLMVRTSESVLAGTAQRHRDGERWGRVSRLTYTRLAFGQKAGAKFSKLPKIFLRSS